MKLYSPPEFLHKNMTHEQLLFMWSTFGDSSMGTKLKYFWKPHKCVYSAWICSQKHVSRTITFHVIHITWFQHGYKVEIFLKNSWMCVIRLNFFTKTCLTNNYFSRDSHFVILAWVQSWNIFEKLMNVCSAPEFFHKNMSHEQLLFTWSTFRDDAPEKTHALLTENLCSLQTSGVIIVLSHGGKLSWMKSNSRCVVRNFDRDGANNNQASTFEYSKPLFFKDSSVKHAFLWLFFCNI